MDLKDVVFLIISIVPVCIAIGAWAQKVMSHLEDIRNDRRT
ncbi:hypothetical protein [Photobacterium alginatilyticum]|nr:hypothetical protein [Photobacterium alginatilyticum]